MGRKVRRVPKDWIHPENPTMYDREYRDAMDYRSGDQCFSEEEATYSAVIVGGEMEGGVENLSREGLK